MTNLSMTNLERLDGRAGPARPISDQQARELVRGALKRVIAGDAAAGAETGAAELGDTKTNPRRSRTAWRFGRAATATVIGALLLGGAALAGLAVNRLWWGGDGRLPSSMPVARPAEAPAPTTETVTETVTGPAPEAEAETPTTATEAPAAHAPLHLKAARPHAPVRAALEPADGDDKTPATGAHADDLLSKANQLRAQRRWRDAAGAYQSVIGSFPNTDSAYVAMLAHAELLLDHLGRPAEALSLFQRALGQPSGLLTEEARYGIASCYRALGDTEKERQALNAFLAAHPHSLLHASAANRLSQLR